MGTPNTLNFQIGVSSVAKNASNALAANNTRVAALEAALIKSGITKRNMQTSGLNIYQNTNNNGVVTGLHRPRRSQRTCTRSARPVPHSTPPRTPRATASQLSNFEYSISNQNGPLSEGSHGGDEERLHEANDIAKARWRASVRSFT